jgi:hypothetical protein
MGNKNLNLEDHLRDKELLNWIKMNLILQQIWKD